MYDYFYGAQADQFSFIRVPAVLFSDEKFKHMSAEAKILYGILLKRMDLSAKNGWFDEQGRVYIICTIEEIMDTMNCATQKATRLMAELEEKSGLIERKRQGLGKPNLIYVKNFLSADASTGNLTASQFKTFENHNSGIVKMENPEFRKSKGSYRDTNDNDNSYTDNLSYRKDGQKTDLTWEQCVSDAKQGIMHDVDLDALHLESIRNYQPGNNMKEVEKILDDLGIYRGRDRDSPGNREEEKEEIPERMKYDRYFKEFLNFEKLCREHPDQQRLLFIILNVLVETCSSKKQYIRVGGYEKPADVVKSQLMKLNASHIIYVLDNMKDNNTRIRNLESYLLTILYKSRTVVQ